MKKVYKYKENRKLNVGGTYKFFVVKKIRLPDDVNYYIIQDHYEEKHLLPARYYKHYHIKAKEFLLCRIDKINCQGRIFFEPVHPTFVPGNQYLFKFIRTAVIVSKKNGLVHYFLMKCETGETAYLFYNNNLKIQKDKYESYKVVRIRKARVYIEKL